MGDQNNQLNARCHIYSGIRRHIVESLQKILQDNNNLIRMFKNAIEHMSSDSYKIVIRSDQTPSSEHVRRYNAIKINDKN